VDGSRGAADRVTRAMVRIAVAAVALTFVATAGMGLTYNSTESVPVGVYRVRPLRGDPHHGDVVGVCLTRSAASLARERGYVHPQGLEPWVYGARCGTGLAVIGKPIAGVPGDTVYVSRAGVFVNGRPLANGSILLRDRAGRQLPHAEWGVRVLGPGEFWIQSSFTSRSYDSRIYGPVYREQIVDRRVPLLIGNGPKNRSPSGPPGAMTSGRSSLAERVRAGGLAE
jgi:conjugative transfer signal peptidase TraF